MVILFYGVENRRCRAGGGHRSVKLGFRGNVGGDIFGRAFWAKNRDRHIFNDFRRDHNQFKVIRVSRFDSFEILLLFRTMKVF